MHAIHVLAICVYARWRMLAFHYCHLRPCCPRACLPGRLLACLPAANYSYTPLTFLDYTLNASQPYDYGVSDNQYGDGNPSDSLPDAVNPVNPFPLVDMTSDYAVDEHGHPE